MVQENARQASRVIRLDRKALLAQASAAQRFYHREEIEVRSLGRRLSCWLFDGPKRRAEDAVEPTSLFASNVVARAQYSIWNFVPRVLLAQLQRPSNLYFLSIALLQTIREVSNTNGIPTILLPLAVVFVCSAIKEALEDRERHRADHVENSRAILTLSPLGSWEQRKWGDLHVGDIVKVMNDQTIPADLFLLSTEAMEHDDSDMLEQVQEEMKYRDEESTEANLAYIETKSLDGETNLKIRTAIPLVAALCRVSSNKRCSMDGGGHNELRGTLVCEQPNNRITSFEGTFSVSLTRAQAQMVGLLPDSDSVRPRVQHMIGLMQTETLNDGLVQVSMPVTAKQLLLRSCVLRNTRAVTGMVVYTGHETKVFCSNTEPVVKTSSVERRLNRLIIGIVLIQQLICFLGALLGAHWMHSMGFSLWYLVHPRRHHSLLVELAKLHLRYFIIMQNFVPISLNVSLEFVKYWQAYFIEQDLEMYDKVSNSPAMVRSSALNEDLGRVHHIFTDKTGTLTMNLMLFRYCMVGGKHYGGPIEDSSIESEGYCSETLSTADPKFVEFDPTDLFADIEGGGIQAERLHRFLRHMALCHTLIPTQSLKEMCRTTYPKYSASSPDEQALVSAAAFCNVRFVHRTLTSMMLMEPGWKGPRTYKLLHVLEFDSDRKRMSVIVETPEGSIELLCKGADNVIFERLCPDQASHHGMSYEQAADQLTLYAKAGMRTLCLAYRDISRSEYNNWNVRYTRASVSMEELVKRRQGCANAIDPLMNEIECGLILLGVTAIQDKLQAGVPATLRLLQETNIKIWTLTGDKMETAVNIGYACTLLSHDMDVQQIGGDCFTSTEAALNQLSHLGQQKVKHSQASPLLASLMNNSRSERRRVRDRRYRRSIQMENLLDSTWASICGLFSGKLKQKRRRKRRPHRHRRLFRTPAGSEMPMYSSVATDAEYTDHYTSDEDSLYDLGVEADDEAVQTPEYGSLAGSSVKKVALVIDGQALELALRPQLRQLFYHVTRYCASTVICCRVSPKQKADIVNFVREFEPDSVTLAIGDGANDVAMIQSAHVGVGISGQEGAQAVNASDYALAQFRFLQRLLFVHGRWAYRRVAKLMSYMLYKNVTYVLTTFWFGCLCGFSGQPLILDVAAQSFNVLYTSVPLVLFAVFDQDVSSTSAAKFPYLYSLGQKNVLLARRVFWPWIFNGVWHSLVIFFVSTWAFEGCGLNFRNSPVVSAETGKHGGLVTLGFVVFTNLVIVVNLKLCLEAFLLTWQFLIVVTMSIMLWFGVGNLISMPDTGFPQATGEMQHLQEQPTFWLICLLVSSSSLLRDALWKIVRRMSLPSMYHILQERELMGLPNSPRRMLREHRQSLSDTAWSDEAGRATYGKLFSNMSRLESPDETRMRSSPLGERLIVPQVSPSTGVGDVVIPDVGFQKERNIRSRGSFQVADSGDTSVGPPVLEPSESIAVADSSGSYGSSFIGVPGAQYRGYAFAEDENVDSDVEAASCNIARGDVRHPKSNFGHASIKRVLKSVRGRKNA